MPYIKSQTLNEWSEMLGRIYDKTQNYSKSPFEIHSHLTEVTGAFGKFLFKKKSPSEARAFMAKMFVWAVALSRMMKVAEVDLQNALLTKYPRVCPYCTECPCSCWNKEKKEIDAAVLRKLYFQNADKQDKSINGFQLMFKEIYGKSWENWVSDTANNSVDSLKVIFTRLVEELAETSEALRFHHLYPSNFSNELADYFAWWFALVSNFHLVTGDDDGLLAEDLLWDAYPGRCLECGLIPCDCRAAPVRELLSKPSLDRLDQIDALTQVENRKALQEEIRELSSGSYPMPLPVTWIVVDVDNFKRFNEEISHQAGDLALKTVANVIRQKTRARDRLFRWGGDEFVVLCPDRTSLESAGMIRRISDALKLKPIMGKDIQGQDIEIPINISHGIAECIELATIEASLSEAFATEESNKKRRREKSSEGHSEIDN